MSIFTITNSTSIKQFKNFGHRALYVIVCMVILVSLPLQFSPKVSADQYDDKINALQQQINDYTNQASLLRSKADTLQTAIARLEAQAAAIQVQINASQVKYDQLMAQIAVIESKLKVNQDKLGTVVAAIYVADNVSPIEMLASSKSVGDFLDKQAYRDSIRDEFMSRINEINKLKFELNKQRDEVKSVMDRQNAEKNSLIATQNQLQELLNQTRGQEAAYQALIASAKAEMAADTAARQAFYRNLNGATSSGASGDFRYSNFSGNQGCSGGYPYCGAQDSYVDPWGLYNRECVSYVAWALSARFGKYVGNFSGQGNAAQWVYSAPNFSGAVRVYDPQPGDAVILPASSFSPLGHAMIVESVSGGNIHISQYNFYGTGEYSTMDIANSGVVFLRFPNR